MSISLTLDLLATIIKVAFSCVNAPFPAILPVFKRILEVMFWEGDDSRVVFDKKFPGEKGSMRWCIVVMQQPVLLLPKFMAKPTHIFM
jgi:hypothetical protein